MDAYYKKFFIFLLYFFIKLSFAAPMATTLQDIQIVPTHSSETIKIKLIFSNKPTLSSFTLNNSPRFVVDIAHGHLQNAAISPSLFYDTPIKTIRPGSRPDQGLRLVFDLNNPANIEKTILSNNVITFQLKLKKASTEKELSIVNAIPTTELSAIVPLAIIMPAATAPSTIVPLAIEPTAAGPPAIVPLATITPTATASSVTVPSAAMPATTMPPAIIPSAIMPNIAQALALNTLLDVNFSLQADANTTKIKFDFIDESSVHYFVLKNPNRLVVDIKNGHLQNPPDPSLFVGTAIKSFRQGLQPNQILRLVFDLNDSVQLAQSIALDNNLTLILKDTAETPVVPYSASATTLNTTPVSAINKPLDVNLSLEADPYSTKIKVHFTDKPSLHYFVLENPDRLVIDIKDGHLQNPPDPSLFVGTAIKSFRQGLQPNQILRLVFDLNDSIQLDQSIALDNNLTLILKNKEAFSVTSIPPNIPSAPSAEDIPVAENRSTSSLTGKSNLKFSLQADTDNTKIKLDFTNKPSLHYFVLENPDRLIIDIKDGHLQNPPNPSLFVGTAIKSFRQELQPNQILRLVFDLNDSVQLDQSIALGNNLTLILKNKEAPSFTSAPPGVPPVPPAEDIPVTENRPTSSLTKKSSPNVNFSLQEDSLLGPIGQIKSSVGFSDTQAAAIELDGGSRVVRANGTYGYAINDDNRVKLSAEYLLENLDFDFYSGDTRQWVDQGAIGADYQYLLDSTGPFKSIEAGGHYSHAPSKDLSTKTITYADGSSITDYRRIAGGDDLNGTMETSMKFWPKSLLTVGGDYDRVRYDTENCMQDGHDAQGLGGHIRLQQLLNQKMQLDAQSTLTQLFNSYGAQLNWIWKSNQKMQLSTGLNSSYTQDHTTERNFWTSGINLNIVWDDSSHANKAYAEPQLAMSNLDTWTQTPAVRMPDVLAITDECVKTNKKPFTPVQSVCPSLVNVQFNGSSYYAPGGWYQSYLQSPTSQQAQVIQFDSANIIGTPSGEVACLYILNGKNTVSNNRLILKNQSFNLVKYTQGLWYTGTYSGFWPPSQQPTPNFMCPGQAQNCLFETVQPG